MRCDLCGKEGELFITEVEGSLFRACEACSSFGKVKDRVTVTVKRNLPHIPVKEQVIVGDYSRRIREARERLGIKQEELAKRIAEKLSVIQKIENGALPLNIELARKLERYLKITLVEEEIVEEKKEIKSQQKQGLTLGDFIRKR